MNAHLLAMRKRTTTPDCIQAEEGTLKKQKFQADTTPTNKEIYSFNTNNFRTFDTTYVHAFCLHSTEPLIAISSACYHFSKLMSVIKIYTLDGDLVTLFEASHPVKIYLSATMMITLNMSKTIIRYNDYGVKMAPLYFSCFDCDMNGNIYGPAFLWWNIIDDPGNSSIDIYSPDLEHVGPFKILDSNAVRSIRIHWHFIVFLSHPSSGVLLSRYSLSKAELLQTVRIDERFILHRPIHLSFDPLGNLLISCRKHDKVAVWYLGGNVRYYKPKGRAAFNRSFAVGLEMTNNFQLIRVMNIGSIRVYEGVTV